MTKEHLFRLREINTFAWFNFSIDFFSVVSIKAIGKVSVNASIQESRDM